jgi:hypothetical protein
MRSRFGYFGSFLICAVILLALVSVGCVHRVYDPYYHDYHRWNHQEVVYYNQWAVENHIDPHRDFRHLSKEDQKRYFDWRHRQEHH